MKNKDFKAVKAAAVIFSAWRAQHEGEIRFEGDNAVISGVERYARYHDIVSLTRTGDAMTYNPAKKEMSIPLAAVDPGALTVVLESDREDDTHYNAALRALLRMTGGAKVEQELVGALEKAANVSATREVASIFSGDKGVDSRGDFNAAALSLRIAVAQAEDILSTHLRPHEFNTALQAAARLADAAAERNGGPIRSRQATLHGI